MNILQIIAKKRDGGRLSADEITQLITGYVSGEVPDYQMSAWAMAVYLRGMDADETAALTEQMLRSGAVLSWSPGVVPKVDKHSTGGVGDKISLVLAPLLACAGLQVPMISGRGLGATGGTLDKLEAIPGFRTNLSSDEIRAVTEHVGCVITGATADLVPADRKLYSLRDVTATVASIPLITASIMSKKLAESLDALVLDVKHGTGAFMKAYDDALTLARSMVAVGQRVGLKTVALVTDMNQPTGRLCGNAVEVNESVAALEGRGPADLMELVLAEGAEVLVMAGSAATTAVARQQLQGYLDSGVAREKFGQMVAAQGGNLDAPRPVAPQHNVPAPAAGYVSTMDVEALGMTIVELGGGRKKLTDKIDPSVGLEMMVRIGERVERGQPLVRVFASAEAARGVTPHIERAITLSEQPVAAPPLVAARIDA